MILTRALESTASNTNLKATSSNKSIFEEMNQEVKELPKKRDFTPSFLNDQRRSRGSTLVKNATVDTENIMKFSAQNDSDFQPNKKNSSNSTTGNKNSTIDKETISKILLESERELKPRMEGKDQENIAHVPNNSKYEEHVKDNMITRRDTEAHLLRVRNEPVVNTTVTNIPNIKEEINSALLSLKEIILSQGQTCKEEMKHLSEQIQEFKPSDSQKSRIEDFEGTMNLFKENSQEILNHYNEV
jgi:hypothetical protein